MERTRQRPLVQLQFAGIQRQPTIRRWLVHLRGNHRVNMHMRITRPRRELWNYRYRCALRTDHNRRPISRQLLTVFVSAHPSRRTRPDHIIEHSFGRLHDRFFDL